jgi:hypothetical protein
MNLITKNLFSFSSKRLFVGGNWKSNNTQAQTKALIENTINKLSFDSSKLGINIDFI